MKINTVSLASLAESIAFAVHAQPRIRDEKKTYPYEDNADDMKNHKLNFEFFSKFLTKVNLCN